MFLGLFSIIVFIATIFCLSHWRSQPLYNDDGNWFYEAEFDELVCHYKLDYYGISSIAKVFRKIYPVKTVEAYHDMKIIWFALLNTSVFILCQLLFNDYLLSFAVIFFHLIFQTLPWTGYGITYGENFLLLPIVLACLCFYIAFTYQLYFLYFITGILVGWAYEIKIVAIIIAFPLFCLSIFYLDIYSVILLILGFPVLLLSRFFFIKGLKGKLHIVAYIFKYHTFFYLKTLKLYKPKQPVKRVSGGEVKQDVNYLDKMQKNKNQFIKDFAWNILPSLNVTSFICVLAITTMIFYLFNFNIIILAIIISLISCIAIPIIEKQIPVGHFGQVYLPLSILAAIGFNLIVSTNNYFMLILVFLAFVINFIQICRIIYEKHTKFAEELFDIPRYITPGYNISRKIGEDINKMSNPDDKLFVWGSFPSVYIYAQRKTIKRDMFNMYYDRKLGVAAKLDGLYKIIKNTPPRFILFHKFAAVDHYTIEEICQQTNQPYRLRKKYPVINVWNQIIDHGYLYELDPIKVREKIFGNLIVGVNNREKNPDCKRPEREKLLKHPSFISNFNSVKNYITEDELIDLYIFDKKEPQSEFLSYINVFNLINSNQITEAQRLLSQYRNPQYQGLFNLAMGEVAFMKNELQQAHQFLSKCLEFNPNIPTAWNDLGVLCFQTGLKADAKNCFERALELQQNYIDAKENLKKMKH